MNIVSIAVVCLIAAMLARLLKTGSAEISFAITCICVFSVLGYISGELSDVFSSLNDIIARAGVSSQYVSVAIKVLGISYICELCASSCRDAGESALGSAVDISGRIAITVVCMPIITALMEVISKILEK